MGWYGIGFMHFLCKKLFNRFILFLQVFVSSWIAYQNETSGRLALEFYSTLEELRRVRQRFDQWNLKNLWRDLPTKSNKSKECNSSCKRCVFLPEPLSELRVRNHSLCQYRVRWVSSSTDSWWHRGSPHRWEQRKGKWFFYQSVYSEWKDSIKQVATSLT